MELETEERRDGKLSAEREREDSRGTARVMAPWLDDELDNPTWCLGMTFRCTPSETIGIWSVVFFYLTVVVGTAVHSSLSNNSDKSSDSDSIAAGRRRRNGRPSHRDGDEDLLLLCLLLPYFFGLAAGCLAWALWGGRTVHPRQSWPVQLLGAAILTACSVLFVAAHVDLGRNWSPVPRKLRGHELVTTGLYGWARHPMYAAFLWAAVGASLATLNWLVAWCVSVPVALALRRIPREESDMLELFGQEYEEYQERVPALGFPFVGRRWWHRSLGLLSRFSMYETVPQ